MPENLGQWHSPSSLHCKTPSVSFICPSGSWVELEGLVASAGQTEAQDTTASFLQGELERILLEAQLECERSSQTESPPQVVTPRTSGSPKPASEGSSSTDCVTIQSDENDRRVSAEWVWDWSSRPENLPPKEFVFHHPKQSGSLSVRKTEVMKRDFSYISSYFLFNITATLSL
uniref:Zgc:73226 n=1 Tax=Sinocyclocheilus rhinocerous TaxID=307959 RepID=A0A673J5S3_9TELE